MVPRLVITAVLMLFSESLYAYSGGEPKPHFDLARIGLIVNGRQICQDKGRLQDIGSEVMEQIIAAGPESIPVLVAMITDDRPLRTTEPIICYWYGMAVGDLAFCLLSDLFTSPTDSKTMPGTSWSDMLGPNDDRRPASDQFNFFVKKHGRKMLQAKWQKLWDQHAKEMYWDPKERCFKLTKSQ